MLITTLLNCLAFAGYARFSGAIVRIGIVPLASVCFTMLRKKPSNCPTDIEATSTTPNIMIATLGRFMRSSQLNGLSPALQSVGFAHCGSSTEAELNAQWAARLSAVNELSTPARGATEK